MVRSTATKGKADPATIVIFGASGDLTRRKLVPALHSLACEGLLSENSLVIGVARSQLTDEDFRHRNYKGVQNYARLKPNVCSLWPDFKDRISYLAGSYDDQETYRQLAAELEGQRSKTGGNRLYYLATPPDLSPLIIEQLGQAGLNRQKDGWTRIVVEKPFGHDLESAQELNRRIHTVFDEEQIYRIDHYLGKETVQNILTLRFANAIFEPLWNRRYIDHVQITVAENVGVEHRAGYYDQSGILRDMFQNHLLQLLTLIAMEPPSVFSANALRDEKVKVLRAMRSGNEHVRAQYKGYRTEIGVDPSSQTPTYAALQFFVDNWRWQGVPFYLRSGKMLSLKTSEIAIQYKKVPHLMFPLQEGEQITSNILSLCIQPDEGIHLRFETKKPGVGMKTRSVEMDFHYAQDFGTDALPEAYERLLLDAMQGDASLFARADEIELAWGLVDPILESWKDPQFQPLAEYLPGSWGPSEAENLLARQGRTWYQFCGTHSR